MSVASVVSAVFITMVSSQNPPSKEFSDTELKSFKYKGSVLPYSLGDIYDIQPDKEQGNRWLIGHGNFLSYTDINFEKKELQGLNKMIGRVATRTTDVPDKNRLYRGDDVPLKRVKRFLQIRAPLSPGVDIWILDSDLGCILLTSSRGEGELDPRKINIEAKYGYCSLDRVKVKDYTKGHTLTTSLKFKQLSDMVHINKGQQSQIIVTDSSNILKILPDAVPFPREQAYKNAGGTMGRLDCAIIKETRERFKWISISVFPNGADLLVAGYRLYDNEHQYQLFRIEHDLLISNYTSLDNNPKFSCTKTALLGEYPGSVRSFPFSDISRALPISPSIIVMVNELSHQLFIVDITLSGDFVLGDEERSTGIDGDTSTASFRGPLSVQLIGRALVIGDKGSKEFLGVRYMPSSRMGKYDNIFQRFNEEIFDLRTLPTSYILYAVGGVTGVTLIMVAIVISKRKSSNTTVNPLVVPKVTKGKKGRKKK